MTDNLFAPGPTPHTVRSADGKVLNVPEGWGLLPPGDAALTRRVKAAGDHWVVQEKKGRTAWSPRTGAKSGMPFNRIDFLGSVASRVQQHSTLDGAGDFSELDGSPGAVRWQHIACAGAGFAPSCCMKLLHSPGGIARMMLLATATRWNTREFISPNYTHLGRKVFADFLRYHVWSMRPWQSPKPGIERAGSAATPDGV